MNQEFLEAQAEVTDALTELGNPCRIVRQNSNINWTAPCIFTSDAFTDSSQSASGTYITVRSIDAMVGNTKDTPQPGDQLIFPIGIDTVAPETFNIKTVEQYKPDGVTNICWHLTLSI